MLVTPTLGRVAVVLPPPFRGAICFRVALWQDLWRQSEGADKIRSLNALLGQIFARKALQAEESATSGREMPGQAGHDGEGGRA